MDQVQAVLESSSASAGNVDWGQLIRLFDSLPETERRRFSWVTPQQADLKWLKDLVNEKRIDRFIGIGCGSGFLERVISEYCGLDVIGVELKDSWWMSKFHPTIFIPVEFASSPLAEGFSQQDCFNGFRKVLLFCYFNNSVAFNEYLRQFNAEYVIIIGPRDNVGLHTDPMPLSPDFNDPRWTICDCRYLQDQLNVICIYHRE